MNTLSTKRESQATHGHAQATLWAHFTNIALGAWLITSPFTLGYLAPDVGAEVGRVQAERGDLPPIELRALAMTWSDIVSGLLVTLFGALSLSRRLAWAQWANVGMGLWLLFAPLVFWTPSPAAYLNGTLVGSLVIVFAILVPPMPGMSEEAMRPGPDVPPGWTYSPSTWLQRLPIVAFALIGFFIARYLTAYQLGHTRTAGDPFFGTGTMDIITSDVSRAWPVADAGLGAATYMLEVLSGLMGGKDRWRTMPWMVILFGIMVIPLGGVSIYFIIIQPIQLGTWCSLCLLAAAVMVIMIPYSLDEVVASVQYLRRSRRRGRPFWRTLWRGGAEDGGAYDASPGFAAPPAQILKEMFSGGVTFPWTLLTVAGIGVALMFTRLLFGTQGAMADSDHLIGSLLITVTVTALAEIGRPLRLVNLALGAWLVAAPWLLEGASPTASAVSMAIGAAVIALSLPRGALSRGGRGAQGHPVP